MYSYCMFFDFNDNQINSVCEFTFKRVQAQETNRVQVLSSENLGLSGNFNFMALTQQWIHKN